VPTANTGVAVWAAERLDYCNAVLLAVQVETVSNSSVAAPLTPTLQVYAISYHPIYFIGFLFVTIYGNSRCY